jgi:ribosomal protein S24E
MNRLFQLYVLLPLITLHLYAATRGDVKIIEASENIRYLSQTIVKDYFLHYNYPQRVEVKKKLSQALDTLSENFRIIALTSKETDTKDILEFLSYNKNEMADIFNKKYTLENASLLIDYSETLLEGIDSIAQDAKYAFSKEEQMIMVTKQVAYLLQRTLKYYIILRSGFDTKINYEMLMSSITKLEKNLSILTSYNYPYQLIGDRKELTNLWGKDRIFIEKYKKLFIPILLFSSVKNIELLVNKLALYHSKNQ